MTNRLTSKKLNNKRFRTTEEAILLAYYIVKDSLSPSRLTRTARISRSTFYRHHESLARIAPDYEAYVLGRAKTTFSRLMKIHRIPLRVLCERVLIFITANRQLINFLLNFGSPDFLEQFLMILEPQLLPASKLKTREQFLIYLGEIATLIRAWCISDYDQRLVRDLIDKIIYLTHTASIRLSPLSSFDHQK